ncbi:type II and III secretion system protein [Flavobacterium beibuense F44-8]|uniref:Type II and III secretion system protein n=1 Tax=Flavobacterium beibuense F44-8 TaxID=1406840 RepID=A0A0A2LQZ1_9FLAO|nr:type II and III secretion system protein [Flavobacterium beibuense]KGO81638.1 type II and III secretion system protein [Flavobacterium beibuense F44-8]
MPKKIYCLIVACLINLTLLAQQDPTIISAQLDEFAKEKPGINEVIKIDVSGLSLHDFISTIAFEHHLNVSVDRDLNQIVDNNFYDVTVKDVFLFLAEKYQLDISFMSNIIIFKKREEVKIVEKKQPKLIDVEYNAKNDFLTVRLQNDSLVSVAKAIVDKSNKSIVLAPNVKNALITSYIVNRPFDQVMDMMVKSNELKVTKDDNGFYYIEKNLAPIETPDALGSTGSKKLKKSNIGEQGYYDVKLNQYGYLSVEAYGADAAELIIEAASKLHITYFLYNKPENEKTTLLADNITFDDLLEHIFKGKKYTYKKEGDFYLIGEESTKGLRKTEIIQLENRSIESVMMSLPKVFSENVEIKEFVELNGLIVSGAQTTIDELKTYIKQIDKVVPLVQIDVMIVQYNKAYDIQTGITAGLDKTKYPQTSGVLFPSGDVNLNATSVNSLIDAFNGLGVLKIGKVTNAFYLNMKFLEDNSIIKIESTPKIATISGHEAKLAIGETNYYFEQNNQLLANNINNNILQSGTWKSTEANLSVSIKPYVSTDETVTLNVAVEKSSFLGRVGQTAPPGKATQQFQSLVRVKNNEMILLGGLDELRKENTASGTPLLSRIPVISWFFSGKRKSKSNSKLHIFIKPTIIY